MNDYEQQKTIIDLSYKKIHEVIKVIEKSLSVMERQGEETFLNLYKSQMAELQKQLKVMKDKTDPNFLKKRQDETMSVLQGEVDYFKQETFRLDNISKIQQENVEQSKFQSQVLKEDKEFMEKQLAETNVQNKILQEVSRILAEQNIKFVQEKDSEDFKDQKDSFYNTDQFKVK